MVRSFNLKKLREVFGRVVLFVPPSWPCVWYSQLGIYVVVTSYRYHVSILIAAKGVLHEVFVDRYPRGRGHL